MSQPTYPPGGSGTPGASPWPGPPPAQRSPYGAQPAWGQQQGWPQQAGPTLQQPGHGQPRPSGPGGPAWGPPAGPPRKKSRSSLIALIVAGVLVVAGIGAALWFGLRASGGEVPAATVQPTGLGTDATLDGYAQQCYDGDMSACDELFEDSPLGSAYETYGGTCAGRQNEVMGAARYCIDAFG